MDTQTQGAGLSRRGFLTGMGALATGAAAIAVAKPAVAHADDTAPATVNTKISTDENGLTVFDGQPLAIGHIEHNQDLCAGCRTCMIACSLNKWGVVNPEMSNLFIKTDLLGGYISEAYICQQCPGAECVAVCPTGACHVDPNTGARVIDPEICVGCKLCMNACPCTPSNIRYNAEKNVCFKCDLCGGDPQCVGNCACAALSCSWIEAEDDGSHVTTDTGIVVEISKSGSVIVVQPDSIVISNINTSVSSKDVKVSGHVASTYTQPFTCKIKASYFNDAMEDLYFSERLEIEVDVAGEIDFEDAFETNAPEEVTYIRLEIMCGKIAG